MAQDKLRVIIGGAGIAGLSAAIALRKLPNVEVELYEQAPEFKEIGASIAISPNGLRTLEKLGVPNALDDEVGFRGPKPYPMIYRHWKTNEVILEEHYVDVPVHRHQTARFHRAHLHEALLEHVPRELIHLNKKIASAHVSSGKAVLQFTDGTSVEGDVLIGADGINSKIRKSFVPDHKLYATGKVFLRSTFDASLVEDIPNLPLDSAHWWGPTANFFASRLGKKQYTTVGNFDLPVKDGKIENIEWNDEGDVKKFQEIFKDWNPVVKELTLRTPYTRYYPNYAGAPLSTWVFDSRVTLLGDAAHTHGGAFAAGGSLAIDDAYALSLAFKHIFSSRTSKGPLSTKEIEAALTLYDKTRRPHTEKLLKIVLGGLSKKPASTGSGDLAVERIKNKPDTTWLSEHNVEKAFNDVVREATEGSSSTRANL